MTDRPLLFSAPMLRALIEGRKTQTRRALKPQPKLNQEGLWVWPPDWSKQAMRRYGTLLQMDAGSLSEALQGDAERCLGYAAGDRIWARETWTDLATQPQCDLSGALGPGIAYRATDDDECTIPARWRPAIHMPRAHSRLTLLVTEVRTERLQDISEADARAEGIEPLKSGRGFYDASVGKGSVRAGIWHHKATEAYAALWNHINGPGAWEANPWVVAVSFTVHQCNIDQMPGGAA